MMMMMMMKIAGGAPNTDTTYILSERIKLEGNLGTSVFT